MIEACSSTKSFHWLVKRTKHFTCLVQTFVACLQILVSASSMTRLLSRIALWLPSCDT